MPIYENCQEIYKDGDTCTYLGKFRVCVRGKNASFSPSFRKENRNKQ